MNPERPPIPVDPDVFEAAAKALAVLALCFPQIVERSQLEEILEDVLRNSSVGESLSERQRLLVWRLCQTVLDGGYNVWGEK